MIGLVDKSDETTCMSTAFDHGYKVAGAYCVCVLRDNVSLPEGCESPEQASTHIN